TVQSIVRQSGGAVWVASEIGQGSTFTVCLPRVASEPRLNAAPRVAKPNSGTETILLVEDDSGVRQLLARILRERGYTVIEACNSDDALAEYEEHGPEIHLMVTDVMMPGMNGLELAKVLRGIRPDLKIICMSGYSEQVLGTDWPLNPAMPSPGMPFLRKPLRPDVLAAAVRETL